MRLLCKCHGVSGSCSSRVCWRAMAAFRAVGASLSRRFDGASRVRIDARRTRLRPRDRRQKRPRRSDLVYVDESPNYCERSPERGSLGTHGRRCRLSPAAVGGGRWRADRVSASAVGGGRWRADRVSPAAVGGGRRRSERALSGCTLLCCERGYRTLVTTVAEDCRCRFVWCCRVECDTCVQTVEQHFCN